MTLYEDLKAAGIPIDHHESDLYVIMTKESTEILKRYLKKTVFTFSHFTSRIDKKLWFNIPFAYDPWWAQRGCN